MRILKTLYTSSLLTGLLLISGCSSDSGGSAPPAATVPANATVINDANAESMVMSIASSLSSLNQALAVQATPVMGLSEALDLIKPVIRDRLQNSGIDKATGVAYSEGGACDVAGSWSASGDETDDGTNYSDTFTATFVNCDDGLNFIINGSLSGTETRNYSTGAYTDGFSGSISVSLISGADTITVSFNGLSFQESGNSLTSTYTTTQSTFALVVTVNGATQVAFLAELSAPIVESTGDSCPESGHILITGGNGSTAEGIYNGDGTMTIKANGSVVNASAPCY